MVIMASRECPDCGASMEEDQITCPDCGTNLASDFMTSSTLSATKNQKQENEPQENQNKSQGDSETDLNNNSSGSNGSNLPDNPTESADDWPEIVSSVISIIALYGLIAMFAWFFLPDILGGSGDFLSSSPKEVRGGISKWIIGVSIVGAVWHSFDVISNKTPRAGSIGKRVISGLYYGLAGLIIAAVVGLLFQNPLLILDSQDGELDTKITSATRALGYLGGLAGFAFGVITGDEAFDDQDLD